MTPETPSAPRLGFVGLGWIGELRLRAVVDAEAGSVEALCDADPGRLEEVGGRFPEASRHAAVDDLLEAAADRELDGVVLATPNAFHASQALAAVERNLPPFVQKPLGLGPAEVEEVLDAARSAGVGVTVDYSYRWTAGARRLRHLVRTGELGEVYLVDAAFHNAFGPDSTWCFDPAISGGGALFDLGVHLIDLALWILGSGSPSDVRGWTRSVDGRPRIDRFAAAELVLPAGVRMRMTTSWNAHTGRDCEFRFAVHGSGGGAELRNRGGSFYDFELVEKEGRSSRIVATDQRTWMDRGIVEWARGLAAGRRYEPSVESNRDVAEVVERIYAAAGR